MTKELTTYEPSSELQKKILTVKALKKDIAKYEKEIKEEALEAMQKYNVTSVKTDEVTISRSVRNTFTSPEPPRAYTKIVKALDTDKVKKEYELTGELPEGIELKSTEYITFR